MLGGMPRERAPADVVRLFYECLNRNDVDGALAVLDPAIHWEWPQELPESGLFIGIQEVEATLRRWLEAWQVHDFEEEELLRREDEILILLRIRARGAGSDVPVDTHSADWWELRNGRPVRLRIYLDREQARRRFLDRS
jgi:ketosteroid isomerase-like protein